MSTIEIPELPGGTSASRGFWSRVLVVCLGVVAGVIVAAGLTAVVGAGFSLSFDAIRRVAIAAYIRPDWAWFMPVAVDGSMAVATVTAVVMRWLGQPARYPWFVVLSGSAISVACNALHAVMHGGEVQLPALAAMFVSAIPALNLALSVHLLVLLILALAGKFGAHLPPPVPAQLPVQVPVQQPVQLPPAPSAGFRPEVPAEGWAEPPAEEAAEARTEARRRPPGPRNRKKTVRRSAAETRQLAEELAAQFPEATKAEIARRLGITDRALRSAMSAKPLTGATA
jgi:hypothetical protein